MRNIMKIFFIKIRDILSLLPKEIFTWRWILSSCSCSLDCGGMPLKSLCAVHFLCKKSKTRLWGNWEPQDLVHKLRSVRWTLSFKVVWRQEAREDSHRFLVGQSWGAQLAPPLAANSVCCSGACQLSLTLEGWQVMWSPLLQHSDTARDVSVPWWGTHTGEPHTDLQAGPAVAVSLVQAGSKHYSFIEANPEWAALSFSDECYLSSPPPTREQASSCAWGSLDWTLGKT